mgnify:CR=1 FL=1
MKSNNNSNTIMWALVVGVPIFLLIEYPVIFWFVLVPLVVMGIFKFIMWIKK